MQVQGENWMLSSLFQKKRIDQLKQDLQIALPSGFSLVSLSLPSIEGLLAAHCLRLQSYDVFWAVAKHIERKALDVRLGSEEFLTVMAALRAFPRRDLVETALNALRDAARVNFENSIGRMLQGGNVDREERQRLAEACCDTGWTMAELEELFERLASPFIQPLVRQAVEGGLYSPEDQARLEAKAHQLGIDSINLSPQSNPTLAEARKRWELINNPLPEVDCPLMLEKGEICHGAAQVQAFEPRTRTVRAAYHGPAARIRLAKGLSYNMASYSVGRETETYTHPVGSGWLVITNKRIIFSSNIKMMSVALSKIVDWTFYTDAVEIKRATGRPITFVNAAAMPRLNDILVAARSQFIG